MLSGIIVFVIGIVLRYYASERNCLIALNTRGQINFWTAIEMLGGLIALAGFIITLIGLLMKK